MSQVAVMTLYEDGTVDDQGLRLDTGGNPEKAAVSPDAKEAAVIWSGYPGGPGTPKGVTFINLDGDPAAEATVSFTLDLDVSDEGSGDSYQQSPVDIIYVTQDEVLIGVRGPDVDGVIPATRNGTAWELGKFIPVDPGGFEAPLEVHGIPGTDDALVLTFGNYSSVFTIRRTGVGEWDIVGDRFDLDTSTLRVAVHKDGAYAYLSSTAPIENIGDPEIGRFQIFEPGASGAWTETKQVQMSGSGSQTIIDPNGLFAVVPDYSPGPDHYTLMTFDLADPSNPKELPTTTDVDGFLMRDFEIGPDGQMIVSIDVGGDKQLQTLVQATPGKWSRVWGPVSMPGGIDDVAVAKVSRVID
jgi:hypothetical protein